MPVVQTWFVPHARSQAPQFPALDDRSTQRPEPAQYVWPEVGHAQAPDAQTWADGQRFPHPPQFVGSTRVSIQLEPHSVCPVGHVQTPATQVWVDTQAWPHAPQFAESVWRFTQFGVPEHDVSPIVHRHIPPLQVCPPVQ